MKLTVCLALALYLCACSSTDSNSNPQTANSASQLTTSSARFATGTGPAVLAGEVSENGTVLRGTGFTARHVRRGEYLIFFKPGYTRGCIAMVVTVTEFAQRPFGVIAAARQFGGCKQIFHVEVEQAGTNAKENHGFQFVAVQE